MYRGYDNHHAACTVCPKKLVHFQIFGAGAVGNPLLTTPIASMITGT